MRAGDIHNFPFGRISGEKESSHLRDLTETSQVFKTCEVWLSDPVRSEIGKPSEENFYNINILPPIGKFFYGGNTKEP